MKTTFAFALIISLSFAINLYGQKNDTLKIDSLYLFDNQINSIHFSTECPYNVKGALKAIKDNNVSLVIQGGFQGFGKINEVRKNHFIEKYNVKLEFVGFVRMWDIETEDFNGFNNIIFDYLAKNHGSQVKKEFYEIWE